MAAENAIANTANIHRPNTDRSGRRRNTKAPTRVEKRHGQIRRGAGRFTTAAPISVAKVTIALNGRIRMVEKSMPEANDC